MIANLLKLCSVFASYKTLKCGPSTLYPCNNIPVLNIFENSVITQLKPLGAILINFTEANRYL